jgi:hypothetical protein
MLTSVRHLQLHTLCHAQLQLQLHVYSVGCKEINRVKLCLGAVAFHCGIASFSDLTQTSFLRNSWKTAVEMLRIMNSQTLRQLSSHFYVFKYSKQWAVV